MKDTAKEIVVGMATQILSRLFHQLCNCKRNFPELEQNLAPKFHLVDCPYRIEIEKAGVEFEDE